MSQKEPQILGFQKSSFLEDIFENLPDEKKEKIGALLLSLIGRNCELETQHRDSLRKETLDEQKIKELEKEIDNLKIYKEKCDFIDLCRSTDISVEEPSLLKKLIINTFSIFNYLESY